MAKVSYKIKLKGESWDSHFNFKRICHKDGENNKHSKTYIYATIAHKKV